jgi:hypothetical protein
LKDKIAHHRVYLLNQTNRISDWQTVDRGGDDAAVLAAATLGARSDAAEIWRAPARSLT